MTDPRAIPMIEAQDKARAEKIKELKAEIARLREAIKREAWNHRSRSRGEFGIDCVCDICEIAREEKS